LSSTSATSGVWPGVGKICEPGSGGASSVRGVGAKTINIAEFNDAERPGGEPVPWLGALVCASAFDLAVHDAYGVLHEVPTYETYNARFMNADLDDYLEAADGADVSFAGRYPEEFLVNPRPRTIPAWHLVGGNDPIDASQLTGAEPDDGYPVLLRDWIRQDGLKCLKVKLRGDDFAWDFDRLTKVGEMAIDEAALWLTACVLVKLVNTSARSIFLAPASLCACKWRAANSRR